MTPATRPRPAHCARLLIVDGPSGTWRDARFDDLPTQLGPGDLLVVNDAYTLPASLRGRAAGQDVELRLAEAPDARGQARAILFGAGDWHLATEERPLPPALRPEDTIEVEGHSIQILAVDARHPRLVRIAIDPHVVWQVGRPVQYRYLDRDLRLSEVQTPYGTHPWAVEMPSAGRPLTLATLSRLRARGVRIATLTHAAGLSSTGDPRLDDRLPLPERYVVPPATWRAVGRAGRVIAVGTSVVRALESAARGPLRGITDLRIGPGHVPRIVHGLLSGMHEPGESHFALMKALAPEALLAKAHHHAEERGYHNHEFGDSTLLWAMRTRTEGEDRTNAQQDSVASPPGETLPNS